MVQQLVQGVTNGVIVQGCGEGGVQAAPPLPGQDAPFVDAGIEGGFVLRGGDVLVQFTGRVDAASVRVEGHLVKLGGRSGSPPAEAFFHSVVESASQEDGPLGDPAP